MDEDPYESIIIQCQITSSQEEKLENFPGFRKSEKGKILQCSVQPTGIVMVSPPESFKDPQGEEEEEEEAFHTPPEHPHSQSISSSGDQGPGAVNPQPVNKKDCGADVEILDVDIGCKDAERTVDLDEDSDTQVFSEPNLGKEYGSGDGFTVSKNNRVSVESLHSESPNVNLGDTEPIVIETESIEIGSTEVVDLDFEEKCKELLTENTVNMDKRVKETEVGCGGGNSDNAGANGGVHSASKNIEDLDKFKYVPCGGTDKCGMEGGVSGRRELPRSFKEPEKNEGLWVPRVSSRNKKPFKDLFDVGGIVVDDSKETDFLETAKERGIIFPRPRWWPPEGFGGQGLD